MIRIFLLILAGSIIVQRLFELRLAEKNKRWAIHNGAKEFGAKHYPIFFLLHSGWMLGWIAEGWETNFLSSMWIVWLSIFLFAQFLRYWAIKSLGKYWNTRILVVPGSKIIRSGPYRFLRHPNYIAVVLELFAVPMIFFAWKTAVIAAIANLLVLILLRIPEEEKALSTLERS